MPRNLTILGMSALIIMAATCIAVGLIFYCHLTGSDDALDEIADGDGSSLPADFNLLHSAPLSDARQNDHA